MSSEPDGFYSFSHNFNAGVSPLNNKYPPAKPEVFHFRAVSPNTTSSAQVALMTTWQSCDCYLPPVNGPFLCLTFFSYAFAPLFLFLISIFPFTFLSLLFLLFLPFFLSPFLLLVFCSSAKPLLNPRTIRGFSYTKNPPENIPLFGRGKTYFFAESLEIYFRF